MTKTKIRKFLIVTRSDEKGFELNNAPECVQIVCSWCGTAFAEVAICYQKFRAQRFPHGAFSPLRMSKLFSVYTLTADS